MTAAGAIFGIGSAFANLDPFLVLPKVFGADTATGFVGKLCRFFLCVQLMEVAIISYRALFLTAIVSSFHRIEILKVLSDRVPIKQHIAMYRESAVISRIMHDFEFTTAKWSLVALFFAILLGVNITIIGIERGQTTLVVITLTFTLAAIFILHIIFVIGCSFHNISDNVLFQWSMTKHNVYSRRETDALKRTLRSLQIISYPAGGMGIIDKDMKISYWESLLGNLVDTIMARDSL